MRIKQPQGRCQAIIVLAAWLAMAVAWPGSGTAMTLDEARAMVKAASDANRRGDHAQAVQLAKQVMDEMGDVMTYWPGEGAKHPAPEADIHDPESFARAQIEAADKTGAEVIVLIAGTNAASEMLRGYRSLKRWRDAVAVAALRPDDYHLALRKASRHLALQEPGHRSVVVAAMGVGRLADEVVVDERRVWVAARELGHLPGAVVFWDAATRSVRLFVHGRAFALSAGSRQVLVEGRPLEVPEAPRLVDDRLWVTDATLEAMGFRRREFPDDSLLVIEAPGLMQAVPRVNAHVGRG